MTESGHCRFSTDIVICVQTYLVLIVGLPVPGGS